MALLLPFLPVHHSYLLLDFMFSLVVCLPCLSLLLSPMCLQNPTFRGPHALCVDTVQSESFRPHHFFAFYVLPQC